MPLTSPALLQSLFGEGMSRKQSYSAQCCGGASTLSLLVLSPALVLQSSCQKQEKTLFLSFWLQGWEPELTGKRPLPCFFCI